MTKQSAFQLVYFDKNKKSRTKLSTSLDLALQTGGVLTFRINN